MRPLLEVAVVAGLDVVTAGPTQAGKTTLLNVWELYQGNSPYPRPKS